MDTALSLSPSARPPARPGVSPTADDLLARQRTPTDGAGDGPQEGETALRRMSAGNSERDPARVEAPGVSAVIDDHYTRRSSSKAAARIAKPSLGHLILRSVNQGISYGLLVAGLGLVLYGLAAVISAGPEFDVSFPNSPLDKTFWPLIGGLLVGGLGAGRLLYGSDAG